MHTNESEFDLVHKLAMKLPDVEEDIINGDPSWKLGGIVMVSMFCGPVWFTLLDLIGAYPPSVLAEKPHTNA